MVVLLFLCGVFVLCAVARRAVAYLDEVTVSGSGSSLALHLNNFGSFCYALLIPPIALFAINIIWN
jgi:hypothetical protein